MNPQSPQPLQAPENLLVSLRELKQHLFSRQVSEAVKQLAPRDRESFVAERGRLTETLIQLETIQLTRIRSELELHGEQLNTGITELTEALSDLEDSAQWAQSLGKVLSLVSSILPAV